jgi:GTP:adenosylcobinamide-phosphate guanylyltransferase
MFPPMPLSLRDPVVILSRGHGSRLAPVATGRHKTTEPVLGRPILQWILSELATLRTPLLAIHLRDDDPDVRRITATHPQPVQITTGQPRGYLIDVNQCTTYGPRFHLIEADTITYPGSLRNFLLLADQLGDLADLCVGVAPATANPNGPALLVDEAGTVQAMSWTHAPTGLVPLGAWHWTSRLLHDAPDFATRSTSTADYVSWAVPHGATVVPVGIPAGFNINTPTDLANARAGVARWLTLYPQTRSKAS